MTLSQELRQSIIQQVLSGKQYRDISKEMGISIGSIANIAKKHRAENERACSKQGQPKSSDVNISDVIKSIDSSTFHGLLHLRIEWKKKLQSTHQQATEDSQA